jgi:hypothetical protein
MIPGEWLLSDEAIEINAGRQTARLSIRNTATGGSRSDHTFTSSRSTVLSTRCSPDLLRRLERDGFVKRTVYAEVAVRIELAHHAPLVGHRAPYDAGRMGRQASLGCGASSTALRPR